MPNGNDHYDPWTERIKAVGSLEGFLRYLVYAVIIMLQLRNGGKVDNVAVKADLAVAQANQAAEDASTSAGVTLKTNKALNEWKASYTKAPKDMQEVKVAERMLEKHDEKTASKPQP